MNDENESVEYMSKVKVDLETVYDLENPPFQECPYCGCNEFYVNEYISGPARFHYRFDGSEADNGELYEATTTKETGVYAYCAECDKKVFRYRNKR